LCAAQVLARKVKTATARLQTKSQGLLRERGPCERLLGAAFGALRGSPERRGTDMADVKAAKRVGGTGGRPSELTQDDLHAARTLLTNPDITVADIRRPDRRIARVALSLFARRTSRQHSAPMNSF
jgi:hypothetical protein